jgi:hypothetical protein
MEAIEDLLFLDDPMLCAGTSTNRFDTRPWQSWRGRLAKQNLIIPSPMRCGGRSCRWQSMIWNGCSGPTARPSHIEPEKRWPPINVQLEDIPAALDFLRVTSAALLDDQFGAEIRAGDS